MLANKEKPFQSSCQVRTLKLTRYLGCDEGAGLVQHLLRCGQFFSVWRLRQRASLDGWHHVNVEAGVPAGQFIVWNRHRGNQRRQENLEKELGKLVRTFLSDTPHSVYCAMFKSAPIYQMEVVLTLWCCLTMETRFWWKTCLLSSRTEADRTGRVLFWSEDDSHTHTQVNKHKSYRNKSVCNIFSISKDSEQRVLTRDNDRLHSQLVAALLNAAVEGWNVLFLSECVGLRKHSLNLTHVALLKASEGWIKKTGNH